MKGLSVSCIAWPATQDEQAFALLAQLGVAGVEVAPTRIAPWESLDDAAVRAYRSRLAAHGLRASSLQAVFYGRPDVQLLDGERAFAAMQAHVERVAGIGAALGAEVMVFGAPAQRRRGARDLNDALALAADRLAVLGEVCARAGLTLGIEPVPVAYGADFLLTWREVAALVEAIGHEAVRVHLDTGCVLVAGDDIAEAIAACAPVLAHFHAAEPDLKGFAVPVARHETAASALRKSGYPGWVAVEMREQVPAPLAALQTAAVAMAAIYAGCAPGPR